MSGCCSTIVYPPLVRRLGRRLKRDRRHSPIRILNDDVLLNIFHLYRLADPDEYDEGFGTVLIWRHQRWWYKLAHVCRQWRNIILESPSQLDLHLFCTFGVPVADMLAHSPPLPLTIYYNTLGQEISAEDESGILLALSHRDRVRHILFSMLPNPTVGNFVTIMDNQFPILERMYIHSETEEVVLPVTFQAPNLRYLRLWPACLPIGSPLLSTTAAGLVTLSLLNIPTFAYFPPSYILTQLSLMVQLERLSIGFKSPIPNRDVERHPRQTPDMITLPNLRRFEFSGMSAYLEGLVARISIPSLNTIRVYLSNQLSFTIPRLLQFIQTSENLTFSGIQVSFRKFAVSIQADPWKESPLSLWIRCRHLDWQVASAAQFLDTLSPVLSIVEQVTFSCERLDQSSDWHNNVDRGQWRELLRPFTGAKIIRVQDDLVSKIVRSLPSDDGEPPLELLPNLEKVEYCGESDAQDAFTTLLNERQAVGHPISLHLVGTWMFYPPWYVDLAAMGLLG